ncbi:ankyrin repeat-containing domain protein [Chytriomyces sp. MP71]|nr:ankyrin repeat-containing domain protein [Chytriomyces sp. MP71]
MQTMKWLFRGGVSVENLEDNALIQASMFDRAELVQWLLYRGVAIPVPPTTSTNTDTSNSSSSKPESPGPAPSTLPLSDIHNLVTLHGLTTALVLSAKHPGALGTLSIVLAHPLADVNACDGSPLAWAARTGGLDAVRLLLAHGADPRARGGIAGLWAAEYGHTAVVRLFVEQGGMDVHAQEEYGLRWAVARGQVETVEYLCTVGAMVDAMGGFALRHAVQMGHDQIVDILLRYGADVSIAGNMANTRDGVDDDNDNANDGSDEEIRSSESMADEGNALVRWALRAHNFALAEKLKETLRANRIRGRMHILDLG